jgi:membrane-bound lytic murein transglycosylase A
MRGAAVLLSALLCAGPVAAQTYTVLEFSDLPGWAEDDHQAALEAFRGTCPQMTDPDWHRLCAVAMNPTNARSFFELFFRPVQIEDGTDPHFTGYFEPEMRGTRLPSPTNRTPVYRYPGKDDAHLSRREIEQDRALGGRGLEIAWVDSPVDLFFAQIQGSARIRLQDGSIVRLGYGGHNGYPFRSLSRAVVEAGVMPQHQATPAAIRDWVDRNSIQGLDLLWSLPSYVFFRELDDHDPSHGPKGAMNWPLTDMRSLAVDPAYVPLGALVWLEKDGQIPMARLMVAQDTGSAIKGAQRADVFVGSGDQAGDWARTMSDGGRMAVLFPIQSAYALAEGAEDQ